MLIYLDTFGAKNRPRESDSNGWDTWINMQVWFDYRNSQFLADLYCQKAFSVIGMQDL